VYERSKFPFGRNHSSSTSRIWKQLARRKRRKKKSSTEQSAIRTRRLKKPTSFTKATTAFTRSATCAWNLMELTAPGTTVTMDRS